ncbi:Serine/threonine-protein kinase [Coemansia sp. RSA 1813]|nr:Serine/threonine-protein kinase [Coemansia sp. RSA 1646]KAJ1771425.1 Serine/threonine-protein kinase [Coemansia sp. RSA 1843]KAJ2089188.1 Serine/threonine-protein kinase [Coemansia sp. RSA 986]KAJ2213756.1 Serine/threonine-protein kinase [Coemansia sp. RSA 487]KAJ2569248.1 Serine/threonine-protein kinase [Coemansia sp. RSA 1813]
MPENERSSSSISPRQRATVIIGDYELGSQIGRGSFATVYKGVNKRTNTLVAIKSVVRSSLTRRLLENLETEINILRTVKHPSVVELIDCLKSRNHIHLVMEYCSLGDLASYMRKRKDAPALRNMDGGLNMDIARSFVCQLGSAMRFLRSRDIIHRDIKTQNLLLQPPTDSYVLGASEAKGNFPLIKVADFGFARNLPSTALAETLCGSPLYMAPEILHYEPYDAKADLWSIGAVIYEMMAGRPPFHASNHVELARVIERTNDRIVFPDEKPDHARAGSNDSNDAVSREPIDPVLKDLVRQLLKMNPGDRMLFDQFFAHPALQPQNARQEPYPHEKEPGSSHQQGALSFGSDTNAQQPPSSRERAASRSSTHTRSSSLSNEDSMRKDAIYNHHRHYLRQAYPPPAANASQRESAADAHVAAVHAMEDMHIGRGGSDTPQQQHPDTYYYDNGMGSLRPKHNAYNERMTIYPPEQHKHRGNSLSNELSVVTSPQGGGGGHRRQGSTAAEEEQALAEREYVVIEKRAVEMNVLADELESSPRTPMVFYPPRPGAIQQAPGVARQMSALARAVREAVSAQYNISTEAANGPLNSKLDEAPEHALNSSSEPRGSTPTTSKRTSTNSNGVFNPLDTGLADTFESRYTQGTSQEDPTIRRMEGLAYKALAMSYLADMKWRLLPSSITGRTGGGSRTCDALTDLESGFLNSSDISIEEAFALYLRALALLHHATIEASRYWRRIHGPSVGSGSAAVNKQGSTASAAARTSIGSSAESGGSLLSGSVTVSVAFNNAVQWVRNKFNECLERAEMLKQLANGNELDNVAQVPVVQVLYEQALALSKAAAIRELKWIDPLDCDRAYQLAIWMLSAILETADAKHNASHLSAFQTDHIDEPSQQYDEMELEDRTIVEQFIASIVKRRETLQRRLMQQQRHQQDPNDM